MNTPPLKPDNHLKDSVLQRLEREAVTPTPKWYWHCIEGSLWLLWGISILFGALSVSIMLFAGSHIRYALFEATHDSPAAFAIDALPYIWVLAFTLMAALAYKNFRNTKHGYRYPLTQILISSLVFSLVGGLLLHLAGIGGVLDAQLGKTMPLYNSQEEMELRHWQQPELGRMVGRIIEQASNTSAVLFNDVEDTIWSVETKELRELDKQMLISGKQVRLLGMFESSDDEEYFYACGVFGWMFGSKASLKDMREARTGFIDKMVTYHKMRELKEEAEEREEEQIDRDEKRCMNMPVVQKVFRPQR